MCLIVVKNKAEASFSVPDFRASFGRNNDGTGIMYIENGRIVTEKVVGALPVHLEMYYKHMHRPQFILHHRFATQGEKTENNVHPFKVLSLDDGDPYDLYFAHNGNISMNKFSNEADKKLSDTHLFAIEYLQPLMKKYPDIIEQKVFQMMLHDFLGSGNKLAFLRNDGMSYIFNKSQGEEHNGCWLSNKYSIANSTNNTTTKNYGKTHGANSNGYGYGSGYNNYDNYDDGSYAETNGLWHRNWKDANTFKAKASDSLTKLTVNELLESIEQYAGMGAKTLEDLFVTDVFLVYDMINLLSTKEVKQSILDEKAEVVAEQLFELLQGYAKKKAA